jgi:hypothetical protein
MSTTLACAPWWPGNQSRPVGMVSTLAMTDALAKLMIAKGILTERLLAAQLPIESANTETETVNPQIPTAITGTDC